MAMQVIEPVDYAYSMLFSSNVPENDFPAWVSPAVRAIGDQVIYNHKIFKAMAEMTAATDVNPETGVDAAKKWLNTGATNRWKMFDDVVGTMTTNLNTIEVTLGMGQATNSLAMFNVQATSVKITVEDPREGVVYEHTESMYQEDVYDWYSYFFAPFEEKTDFVLDDLPNYPNAKIKIVITAGPGTLAGVGSLILGQIDDVGVACYGSSIGILDYSKKDIDEFGHFKIVKRGFSKFGDFDVEAETSQISRIQRKLSKLLTVPCVWIGYSGYESTIIFGYYKDFTLTIDGPEVSTYNLRIEGMV